MRHTVLTIVGPLIFTMPMVVQSHQSKPYNILHKSMLCLNMRRYTVRDVVFKCLVQTILHHNLERATVKDAAEEIGQLRKIRSWFSSQRHPSGIALGSIQTGRVSVKMTA